MPADDPADEGEGLTRQRQRSTVEKHGKPLVPDEEIVVIASSTGGFLLPGNDTPGYSTPEGGWPQYDIHHILPREYGGTNDFDNLVPVPRDVHQQELNP